jgi:hypothetical protein
LAFQYQKERCQSSMYVPQPFNWWQFTHFADIMQIKLACTFFAGCCPPHQHQKACAPYFASFCHLACVTCFRHQQIIIACSSPMPKNRWGRGSYNAIVWLSVKMHTNKDVLKYYHSDTRKGHANIRKQRGETCVILKHRIEKNHAILFLFHSNMYNSIQARMQKKAFYCCRRIWNGAQSYTLMSGVLHVI